MAKSKKAKKPANLAYFIALIAVIAIVIWLFFSFGKNTNLSLNGASRSVADLLTKVEQATKNDDSAKALKYLKDAKKQITELPTNDQNANTRIDIEAQIYTLEHTKG